MTDVLSRRSLIEYPMGDFNDDPDSNQEFLVYFNRKEFDHIYMSFAIIEFEHGEISQEKMFYLNKTGSKYHWWDCLYLSQSSIPIDLDEAKAKGYTSCSVCNPPTSSILWRVK